MDRIFTVAQAYLIQHERQQFGLRPSDRLHTFRAPSVSHEELTESAKSLENGAELLACNPGLNPRTPRLQPGDHILFKIAT